AVLSRRLDADYLLSLRTQPAVSAAVCRARLSSWPHWCSRDSSCETGPALRAAPAQRPAAMRRRANRGEILRSSSDALRRAAHSAGQVHTSTVAVPGWLLAAAEQDQRSLSLP